MKPILIVVSPSATRHLDTCNTMKTEASKLNKSVQVILDSAFLATGTKSFEIAMSLYRIAEQGKLPVAIFEIESTLLELTPENSKNQTA